MKNITMACALMAAFACPTPSLSDPAVGFGITLLTNGEAAISLRVFSDNRRYKPAASLGVDYNLESESFRPAIGVAYLDRSAYVDATVGIDLKTNEIDFGIGAGGLWNSRAPVAAPRPVPTPPPTGGTGTDAS